MSNYTKTREYNTDNVSQWIDNDEPWYTLAVKFMNRKRGSKKYRDFIKWMGLEDERTPDGVRFLQANLNYAELNEWMKSFIEEKEVVA